jgi:hypothetical protein
LLFVWSKESCAPYAFESQPSFQVYAENRRALHQIKNMQNLPTLEYAKIIVKATILAGVDVCNKWTNATIFNGE